MPAGVNDRDFELALGEFAAVVGAQWVFSSADDVALYRDAYSPFWGENEERTASAALAPANVDEVGQLLRIANRYRIAVYPVSTGRNLAYGGSAEQWDAYASRRGLPFWEATFSFHGPEALATYAFNDGALSRLHAAIKDAVDPNGILASGRYGIWPRHLRAGRQA